MMLNIAVLCSASSERWNLLTHSALDHIKMRSDTIILDYYSIILGANWQLFRLERIAKCSYFILSKQNVKFY